MYLHEDLRRVGVEPDSWLHGSAAQVALTFDVDAETNLLSRTDAYLDHLSTVSHQQYGPRIGVPRILRVLERYRVPGTFFVPGLTAERWPETVAAIAAAGHEVALHGYRHLTPVGLSPDDQRREFERGLAALRRLGIEPAGYRAPNWSTSIVTLHLIKEHGLVYDSSLMDDDRPYRLEAPWGALAELPPHWMLDDWEQYAYLPDPDVGQHIEPTRKVLEIWTEELEAMRTTRSLFVATCHPMLSGRPSRVAAIERFVEFVQDKGDVGFASCRDIAAAVLEAGPAPYADP